MSERLLTQDDVLHMIEFGELPPTVSACVSVVALRRELLDLSLEIGQQTGLHGFADIYMAAVPSINNNSL